MQDDTEFDIYDDAEFDEAFADFVNGLEEAGAGWSCSDSLKRRPRQCTRG
jgi:hypothetical protein